MEAAEAVEAVAAASGAGNLRSSAGRYAALPA